MNTDKKSNISCVGTLPGLESNSVLVWQTIKNDKNERKSGLQFLSVSICVHLWPIRHPCSCVNVITFLVPDPDLPVRRAGWYFRDKSAGTLREFREQVRRNKVCAHQMLDLTFTWLKLRIWNAVSAARGTTRARRLIFAPAAARCWCGSISMSSAIGG
jgi:hypothetical protein